MRVLDSELRDLNARCQSALLAGDRAGAVSLARQALARAEEKYGPDHPFTGLQWHTLGEACGGGGEAEAAGAALTRAIDVRRLALGPDHAAVAQSLHLRGHLAAVRLDRESAAADLREAFRIRRAALGPDHPLTRRTARDLEKLPGLEAEAAFRRDTAAVHNQGQELFKRGEDPAAEEKLTAALRANRERFGWDHPDTVACLRSLADLYSMTRRDDLAWELATEARLAVRVAGGEADVTWPQVLAISSRVQRHRGAYVEAEALATQAVEAARRVVPPDPHLVAHMTSELAQVVHVAGRPDDAARLLAACSLPPAAQTADDDLVTRAKFLNTRAAVALDCGDYALANSLHHESLGLKRRVLAPNDPSLAKSLCNLAALELQSGEPEAATEHLSEAVRIIESGLGANALELCHPLDGLIHAYRLTGNRAEALRMAKRLLALVPADRSGGTAARARTLRRLGALYADAGRGSDAELALRESAELLRVVPGRPLTEWLDTTLTLAQILSDAGRDADAEPLFAEALRETAGGGFETVRRVAATWLSVRAADRDYDQAIGYLDQALAAEDRMIEQAFTVPQEDARGEKLEDREWLLRWTAYLYLRRPDRPDVRRRLVDLIHRRASLTADVAVHQRLAWARVEDPNLRQKLERLISARNHRANLAVDGAEWGWFPGEDAEPEVRADEDLLYAEILCQVDPRPYVRAALAADTDAILGAIPPGAVLVEFALFAVNSEGSRRDAGACGLRCFRVCLDPRSPAPVRLDDLGPAEPILELARSWAGVVGVSPDDRPPGAVRAAQDSGRLGDLLLGDLLGTFPAGATILLAPDGEFWRLPFCALPIIGDQVLIDRHPVGYVTSPRDLLDRGTARPSAGPPVVIADPAFWHPDLPGPPGGGPGERPTGRDLVAAGPEGNEPAWDSGRLGPEPLAVPALPGTRREGERVAHRLGVRPLLGREATEAAVLGLRSPVVLHLATHGLFFASESQWRQHQWARTIGGDVIDVRACERLIRETVADLERATGRVLELVEQLSDGTTPVGPRPPARRRDQGLSDPLVRCGLVLAGFNDWMRNRSVPGGIGNGLVMAAEVAGMDLGGTELVVLSACQSGLGDLRTREGVYGLGRAFAIAGARTVVLSQWSVADDETAVLMDHFYSLLLDGQDRLAALRAAQLAVRAAHPDPYFWAPFYSQGGLGPLPAT